MRTFLNIFFFCSFIQYACASETYSVESSTTADLTFALDLNLIKTADEGNAEAQFILGTQLLMNVLDDPKLDDNVLMNPHIMNPHIRTCLKYSIQYLQLSAHQQYPPALYNMGVLYEEGFFFLPNFIAAEKYYQLAAAQGNKKAKTALVEFKRWLLPLAVRQYS